MINQKIYCGLPNNFFPRVYNNVKSRERERDNFTDIISYVSIKLNLLYLFLDGIKLQWNTLMEMPLLFNSDKP